MYRITIQVMHKTHHYLPTAAKMRQWARAALRHKVRRGEMTIRLVDKQEIKKLNTRYRHKNKPTNVLSFKAELPPRVKLKIPLLGDVVICPDMVNAEAKAQNKAQQAHWAHIVIHGTLHILGYDHVKRSDAKLMEAKEMRLLQRLGWGNPYK